MLADHDSLDDADALLDGEYHGVGTGGLLCFTDYPNI